MCVPARTCLNKFLPKGGACINPAKRQILTPNHNRNEYQWEGKLANIFHTVQPSMHLGGDFEDADAALIKALRSSQDFVRSYLRIGRNVDVHGPSWLTDCNAWRLPIDIEKWSGVKLFFESPVLGPLN